MTNVIDKRVYFLDTSFRVLEHVSGINTEPIFLRKCGDISQRKGSCHSPSLPPFFPIILSALSLPFCHCLLPLLFPEWHLSGPSKIQLQCNNYPVEFQHVVAWNMCVLSLYLPLPLSMLLLLLHLLLSSTLFLCSVHYWFTGNEHCYLLFLFFVTWLID